MTMQKAAWPIVFWRHLFGLPDDDPLWRWADWKLSRADRFFDSGFVEVYRLLGYVPAPADRGSKS